MRFVGTFSGVAFVFLAVACSGTGIVSQPPAKIGERITFEGSAWTVLEAKDLGSEAPELYRGSLKSEQGKLILVRFRIENTGQNEIKETSDPPISDSMKREFKTHSRQDRAFPKDGKEFQYSKIPAGMSKEFCAVYELPKDANGLHLVAYRFGPKVPIRLVNLGF